MSTKSRLQTQILPFAEGVVVEGDECSTLLARHLRVSGGTALLLGDTIKVRVINRDTEVAVLLICNHYITGPFAAANRFANAHAQHLSYFFVNGELFSQTKRAKLLPDRPRVTSLDSMFDQTAVPCLLSFVGYVPSSFTHTER